MKRISNFKHFYLVFVIFLLIVCTIGSTYAYLTSTVRGDNDVDTSSKGYNVSMLITPVYNGFSLIPMDNSLVIKALNNKCKDKFNRGVCNAYNINVFGYDSSVSKISGTIKTSLENIQNLSYMVFERVSGDISGNNDCVSIDSVNYCMIRGATLIVNDIDMSLGDNIDVFGLDNKDILLVIWLSNLNISQNSFDIGNYNSLITMYLGSNGGQVSGSIGGSLQENLQSEG